MHRHYRRVDFVMLMADRNTLQLCLPVASTLCMAHFAPLQSANDRVREDLRSRGIYEAEPEPTVTRRALLLANAKQKITGISEQFSATPSAVLFNSLAAKCGRRVLGVSRVTSGKFKLHQSGGRLKARRQQIRERYWQRSKTDWCCRCFF